MGDDADRGYRLTSQVFPSLLFIPEKLGWAVEDIVEKHSGSIRQAVLDALSGLRSSVDTRSSSALIFDAVSKMGSELFNAALDYMCFVDDNNPPEAYDEIADALYSDGLSSFVTKKYESAVFEIPGLGSPCEPTSLDALRL